MSNPNRRRQCEDNVCCIKAWSKPLVINAFNNPAVLRNDGGEPPIAFRGVCANAITERRALPKEIIQIIDRHAETTGKLCGNI